MVIFPPSSKTHVGVQAPLRKRRNWLRIFRQQDFQDFCLSNPSQDTFDFSHYWFCVFFIHLQIHPSYFYKIQHFPTTSQNDSSDIQLLHFRYFVFCIALNCSFIEIRVYQKRYFYSLYILSLSCIRRRCCPFTLNFLPLWLNLMICFDDVTYQIKDLLD